MDLITCKNISFVYNGVPAVKNLNFSVAQNDYLCIVGENGAGKSTTFKMLLGLVQPDSGEIRIFGKNRKDLSENDRREIGTVLSDSFFSGYLTVAQLMSFMGDFYPGFQKKEFEKQCLRFQLPVDKKLKEFSTGMKAKLKILFAISVNARFLILDEPTAGLDVMSRETILDLLREYMEVPGRGILISSHISSDLEGLCDDIYMIHEGRIIFHEDTDVLLNQYGLLKVDEKQFEELDKRYLLKKRKEHYGYACLTKEKQYYIENYPDIVVEKGTVDELIAMMIGGNEL